MKNGTRNLRCIGGPKHGQMVTMDVMANHVQFPVLREYSIAASYIPSSGAMFDYVIYKVMQLNLGGTRVTVMGDERMSEDAMSRALADFIDGVQR